MFPVPGGRAVWLPGLWGLRGPRCARPGRGSHRAGGAAGGIGRALHSALLKDRKREG